MTLMTDLPGKAVRRVSFRVPSNRTGLLASLALLLLLTGCTASFTYNRLDWLIPWWVDDYVDLTRDQRRDLRGSLEPALRWHREEELGRYLELLDRVESDIQTGVEPEMVRGWFQAIIQAAERVEAAMLDVALDFGGSVSDEQVGELLVRVWERQSEFEEEFLERSDEEYAEDNAEYLVDGFEDLLGRLSDEQEQKLRQAAMSLQRFDSAWLDERSRWLRDLESLLQRDPGWQQAVRERYEQPIRDRTPEYQDILDYNLGVISRAAARVLDSMSDRQRAHLADEIEDWRRLIRKLEAGGDRSAAQASGGAAIVYG